MNIGSFHLKKTYHCQTHKVQAAQTEVIGSFSQSIKLLVHIHCIFQYLDFWSEHPHIASRLQFFFYEHPHIEVVHGIQRIILALSCNLVWNIPAIFHFDIGQTLGGMHLEQPSDSEALSSTMHILRSWVKFWCITNFNLKQQRKTSTNWSNHMKVEFSTNVTWT